MNRLLARGELEAIHSRTPVSATILGTTLVALIATGLVASGCAERKRPTLPWATASMVHPRLPASPQPIETQPEEPGELRLELPALPLSLPLEPSPRPQRPRVASPPPAAPQPSRPQTPFVAPQLSVEESTSAQQETNASLAAAEKGMEAARGKTLNAAQADMSSKINGFMADARAAAATGDWTSAQKLARKAQLLAEELATSLQ